MCRKPGCYYNNRNKVQSEKREAYLTKATHTQGHKLFHTGRVNTKGGAVAIYMLGTI